MMLTFSYSATVSIIRQPHLPSTFCRALSFSNWNKFTSPSSSSTASTSYGPPNAYHLDHIRKRLEFTVPLMFRKNLDFTFYSHDVICDDHLLNVQRIGIPRLMSHLGMYSICCQILFPHIEMETLSIIPILDDGTVRLRWRVKHVSLLRALTNPLMLSYNYRIKRLHWFDGYSIFYVNGEGLVDKMTIQRTIPDSERNVNKKTTTQKIAERIGVLPKEAAASCNSSDVRHHFDATDKLDK
uniref:Ovule protein n=1 Tax=Syphacia muris TaxID=451379 RepID=A0A0N5AVX6_9BILA